MSSDVNNWQQNNQRYLSAALAWLRLRLQRAAQQPVAQVAPMMSEPAEPQHASGRKWHFWDKPEPGANKPHAEAPGAIYATAVHPPTRVPATLNGFGLWNVLVLVLMIRGPGYQVGLTVSNASQLVRAGSGNWDRPSYSVGQSPNTFRPSPPADASSARGMT